MKKLLSAGHIEHKFAVRLQTILLRAQGEKSGDIARFLGIHISTASLYIKRYNTNGIEALVRDKTRKPGKEKISQETKNEIYRLVCNEKPEGETHWNCRTLEQRVGIGHTSVHAILQELGLQPHLVTTRNYSNDPDFEHKLKDIVGLYLKPPQNAIVLCFEFCFGQNTRRLERPLCGFSPPHLGRGQCFALPYNLPLNVSYHRNVYWQFPRYAKIGKNMYYIISVQNKREKGWEIASPQVE
jgi:transposase